MSLSRCRSCGRPIIWAATEKGKAMPVNPEAAEPPFTGNIFLSHLNGKLTAKVVPPQAGLRTSHFATCPAAPKWRKRK